jgi:hypothetical protein
MAPGSVIRLSEKTLGKTRTAEIRERKGVPEFLVQSNGAFHPAEETERRWIEAFLVSMRGKDNREPVPAATDSRGANPGANNFLERLREVHPESEKVSLLRSLTVSEPLNARQQLSLIQGCFDALKFSADRVAVLQSLLKHQGVTREAKLAILNCLDSLSSDSDRMAVLTALAAAK